MKALVLQEPGRLEVVRCPDPAPGPGEVLVRVRACAICGSDVHGWRGEGGRRLTPLIMGHEASGEIVTLGPDVAGWKAGDRVTFDSTQYCGKCWQCAHGLHNLCAHRQILGVACREYRREGAMAELVAVQAHTLYRLPDKVSFAQACLTEPFAVGMHAVRLAGELRGKTVAVIGAGTIGLMTLLAAKSQGCGHLLCAAHHADRQALAREAGAEASVEGTPKALADAARACTEGRGADVVLDSVGSQGSLDTALAAVRDGGTVVVIGNSAVHTALPLQDCVVRQIRLQFSYSSEGEYPICLQAIADGKVNLTPFLRAILPLEQGTDAFRRLTDREPGLLKVILQP